MAGADITQVTPSNRLLWGIALAGLILLLILFWGWSSINTLDQRSKDLQAALAAAPSNDVVGALAKRQDEIEAKLAALPAAPDLAPVESKVDQLQSKLDALTVPDVSALTTRLGDVEAKVAAIQPADLSGVTTNLSTATADIETLKQQLADVVTSVGATDTRVTDVGTQVSALGDRLAALPPATDLAPLQTQLTEMASRLASVTPTDLAPVETEIAALKTSIAAVPTAADLGELRQTVADLATKVAAAASIDIASVEAQVAEVKTAISALQGDISGKASSADLQTLGQQLGALDSRVASLPVADPQLQGEVATLKTALGDLTQQLAAVPRSEEFAALKSEVTTLKDNPAPRKPPQVLDQVFFGDASTTLEKDALAKLSALAAKLKANPQELAIVGFTDSKGPAEFNRSISLRRAAAVRRALIGFGVESATITSISGMGEDAPPVATNDDTEEAGNRVVQIYGHQ